ncbi:alcohol dehydrogenase catalytic domain-containing protein [Solwaraspora sp. WMMB762]|uniref:alcohol dehydrogenase catalytic domain-containing protein n=1 Tax=Solwaraspora sp. WMMB762 TaxID=3404120 RepID=UPI003B952EB0
MRELTYIARRTVEWREAPDPTPESGLDAIVAPVAATSCDVDFAILAGHGFLDPPFPIGHECVAKVVQVGDAVTGVTPGDLVVVPWSISCGTCALCRAGLTAHCASVPHMAMYGAPIGGSWGGLFFDLVRVPWADAMLVPLPAGLDPVAMASASDNWSLAWRLVAPHLDARPGARVLVVARGSIGLYVCDIAGALDAADVLYTIRTPGTGNSPRASGPAPPRRSNPSGTASIWPWRPPAASTSSAWLCRASPPRAPASRPAPTSAPVSCPCSTCTSPASPCALPATTYAPTSPTPSNSPLSGKVGPGRVVSDVLDWEQLPYTLVGKHLKPVFARPLTAHHLPRD